MATWRELAAEAAEKLGSASDARRIVERASGAEGTAYHLALDDQAAERAEPFFRSMVERRAAGEPLQYVVGRWGFRGLDLLVDNRVLIPRPETEYLVEVAIEELRRSAPSPTVVDLGTGSGAIALSIALEVADADVWATDASTDALDVARANLSGLGTLVARRVRIVAGRWFDALPSDLRGRIDLVVSNPPYIGDGEYLPREVDEWEPARALRSGPTGFEQVDHIIRSAPRWLARPGALVVEIAPHQSDWARKRAEAAESAFAEVRDDLNGRPRVLVARWV